MSNDRIVPRIKAMHPATGDGAGGIELPAGQEPILVPLAGDVAIAFAIDTGENYQLLQKRVLEDNPGLTEEQLLALAVHNMINECGEAIQVHGEDGRAGVSAGGNFEACLLLADALWEQLVEPFGADMLAAVPAVDLLFVARNDEAGRAWIEERVNTVHTGDEYTGKLCRSVLQRHDGGWRELT